MEDDDAVKAPLTRLRRRLSVESEVSSPVAPSTPTKKRLAAKPQLDNIDEHGSVSSPQGKQGASSVRGTAEAPEDKPATPARRSTRVRSNTSITSEVAQAFDSPRARRAARRTSFTGSDTEATITPVKKTRARTRKDSASSVENQETVAKPTVQSPISEEPEAQKTSSNNSVSSDSITPNTLRKSQRIAAKRASRTSLNNSDTGAPIPCSPQDKNSESSLNKSKSTFERVKDQSKTNLNKSNHKEVKHDSPKLSPKLSERIITVTVTDKELKYTKTKDEDSPSKMSLSKLEETENCLNKRKSGDKIDGIDTVDTAATNKSANDLESDFLQETEAEHVKCNVHIEDSDSNTDSLGKSKTVKSSDADDQCVPVIEKINQSDEPTGEKSGLIIEDRIPNTVFDDEKPSLFTSKPLNSSVEPMDIDETIPVNVSLVNSSPDNKLVINESAKDLSGSNLKKPDADVNNSITKKDQSNCLDKSILSHSDRHEKTTIGNKSTLILSQLKDDSASDANVTKSPKKTNESLTNANEIKTKRNCDPITKETKTPLKNKRLQKTGMQTSTPVILTNSDQTESSYTKIASPKKCSKSSNKSHDKIQNSDECTDESSMAEISQNKSMMLDVEAEDAGDDYESGDSQDESQRRYEEENEIVHKGETLTSEEDITDDSEYEKDSFVVGSDEEDDTLLSGSGDDLSDGDNELNMTAKSKKKYNERKVKEQKKASREMYEARHGKKDALPISSEEDETSKPVKKNRRRIDSSPVRSEDDSIMNMKNNRPRTDSSFVGSEDDPITKPRKNNRLRLDSSKDISVKSDTNESISKQLVLNDTVTNENEITIVGNESMLQKKDPLKSAVKAEPMTPQKDFDISTLRFSTVMDVEQVQINQNASFIKANETSDPLQATIGYEDGNSDCENEDGESSSENEEIMQNYDSMLSNLNKETFYKAEKKLDISLNLNKKSKEKVPPIMDQLNLTQTKSSRKTEKCNESQEKNKDDKQRNIETNDDESSSDAIELKWLFPDDKESSPERCYPGDEDYIPLKRTEGKTNLRESTGDTSEKVSLPKVSEKKKKLSESSEVHIEDTSDHNASASKKKNKRNSESLAVNSAHKDIVIFEDREPVVEKKKGKDQRHSLNLDNEVPTEIAMNDSVANSKKKKKRLSESLFTAGTAEIEVPTTPTHLPNKKNKKLSVSLPIDEIDSIEASSNRKKKNRKYSEPSQLNKDTLTTEKIEEKVAKEVIASKKRKRNSSVREDSVPDSLLDNPHDLLLADGGQKKKRKISKNVVEKQDYLQETETILFKSNLTTEDTKSKRKETSSENKLEEQVIPHNLGKPKQSKKRKQRGDDDQSKHSKGIKDTFLENITVPRLPTTILDQLDEKHTRQETAKNAKIVSTSAFDVVETRPRKNKPSQYLEESIYLNSDSPEKKRRKNNIEKPKVLPFVPTASTSGSGFTTNFKVNVNPRETTFVAQASNLANFKKDYLLNKKIKKLGTFEKYKKQRAAKLHKF